MNCLHLGSRPHSLVVDDLRQSAGSLPGGEAREEREIQEEKKKWLFMFCWTLAGRKLCKGTLSTTLQADWPSRLRLKESYKFRFARQLRYIFAIWSCSCSTQCGWSLMNSTYTCNITSVQISILCWICIASSRQKSQSRKNVALPEIPDHFFSLALKPRRLQI